MTPQRLIEAKAVDDLYPLYGTLEIVGGGDSKTLLAEKDGALWRGRRSDLLLGRLGIKPGDRIKIGNSEVVLRGLIANEPDRIADGIVLGPRIIMSERCAAGDGPHPAGKPHHLALPGETRQ